MIKFEWNEAKATSNQIKHGVSFDEYAMQFYDESHSQLEEDRFLLLGHSVDSRLLLVCHCERMDGKVIRIISARKATKSESKFYGDI